MANEVTITVVGRDRTGGLFSGITKRADTAFGQVRQSVKTQMEGAASDAEAGGRAVGEKLISGAREAVSGQSSLLAAELTGILPSAGEQAGTAWGAGFTRGAETQLRDAKGRFAKAIVPSNDADKEGRSIGSRIVSGIGKALSVGASAIGSVLSGSLKVATKLAHPILIAGLVAAGGAAGTAAGAALGGALVLALGAAFTGIGVLLLAQEKEFSKSWGRIVGDIQKTMTEASKPLAPLVTDALKQVKGLVGEFKPVFSSVFKDAQVPLREFTSNLINAFKELKPAVAPLMDAFTTILSSIGPQLGGIFKDISSALVGLSRSVIENKSVISGIFTGLLQAIPLVINAITWTVNTFSGLVSVVNSVQAAVSKTFLGATQSVLGFAEKFLGVLRSVGQAIGNIPGMEGLSQKMVAGLDTAIAKVQEWKSAAAEASKAVHLKAEISDLTMKIDQARGKLMDPELTKERRAKLNADIAELLEKKNNAIAALGDPKLVKEYMSSINTEIGTLQQRLATARKELADPNLTKERKSKLNADISQLKAQIAQAKAALASLKDKTVRVTTIYSSVQGQQAALAKASKYAHGGIIGAAAAGGPRSNMTLVGEQGPELVRLPFGSSVIPAGQTQAMLSQAGSGGGVTVNLYVQGSIRSDRDLISLIRDEFLNGGFRGVVTT